jgi:hypothetical protein
LSCGDREYVGIFIPATGVRFPYGTPAAEIPWIQGLRGMNKMEIEIVMKVHRQNIDKNFASKNKQNGKEWKRQGLSPESFSFVIRKYGIPRRFHPNRCKKRASVEMFQ